VLHYFFTGWRAGRGGPQSAAKVDPDDPMSHPALQRMSAGELADIPFPRPARLRMPAEEACCVSRG
jgi:hypothetical protein